MSSDATTMDVAQDPVDLLIQQLNYLRETVFSPTTVRLLQQHVFSTSSTLNLLKHRALSLMAPLINPLLMRLNSLLTNSPDIVILVLVVVIFLVALQVLAWIRRMMMWITGLVLRLMFWALIVAGVAMMWQRGPERTVSDLTVLGSWVLGWAGYVKDFWMGEYQRYDRARGMP